MTMSMSGARQRSVDLFVAAAPPRRCPSLFVVSGERHRRAAVMAAGDGMAQGVLALENL